MKKFTQKTIREWITDNLEPEQIQEVVLHGCESGVVSDLIYYNDTVVFHDHFEDEIWDNLYRDMNDIGETKNLLDYISKFRGSENVGSMYQLKNLLAWNAVENECGLILIENSEIE